MVAYQLLLFPGEQSDHRINYVVVVDTCSCEIIGSTVRHKYCLSLTQRVFNCPSNFWALQHHGSMNYFLGAFYILLRF